MTASRRRFSQEFKDELCQEVITTSREIFTDDVIAAAMIDRLVHHAEVISLKGSSYRMRGKKTGTTT